MYSKALLNTLTGTREEFIIVEPHWVPTEKYIKLKFLHDGNYVFTE